MSLPVIYTKALAAAADNNICALQTPAAAGNMLINGSAASGGVATLDTQRIVLFTFAASEVGHTFVVTGTMQGGFAISETVLGTAAGVVSTLQNFLTVSRITISAAATGAIKVGTSGVGSTPWIPVNYLASPFAIGFGIEVTGTVNYTVQHTFDDPAAYATKVPIAFDHSSIAAQTINKDGNYAFPCYAVRTTINSGTGSTTSTFMQAGT